MTLVKVGRVCGEGLRVAWHGNEGCEQLTGWSGRNLYEKMNEADLPPPLSCDACLSVRHGVSVATS